MARKRMIDPAFFLDNEVASVSPHARLLYIGSWTLADDIHFTLPNNPDWIKVQIFPYEMKLDVSKLITEIVGIGKYIPFANGDKKQYLFIPTMAKHQTINRPSAPKYPAHPEAHKYINEYSVSQGVYTDSRSTHSKGEDKLKEYNVEMATGVITLFNKVCGTKYEPSNKHTVGIISARITEGALPEDFEAVIRHKFMQWGSDPKMKEYLRPSTLFIKSHWEDYLNAARRQPKRRSDG